MQVEFDTRITAEEPARARGDYHMTGLEQADLKLLHGSKSRANLGTLAYDQVERLNESGRPHPETLPRQRFPAHPMLRASHRNPVTLADLKISTSTRPDDELFGRSPTDGSYIEQHIRRDGTGPQTGSDTRHQAENRLEERFDDSREASPIGVMEVVSDEDVLNECRSVLQIADLKNHSARTTHFDACFSRFETAVDATCGEAIYRGVVDPHKRNSELDFLTAIRMLLVHSRGPRFSKAVDLFARAGVAHELRQGRQQFGAVMVASAYVPEGEALPALARFLQHVPFVERTESDKTPFGEVNKRILRVSSEEERVSVFFNVCRRLKAIPHHLKVPGIHRLSRVTGVLHAEARDLAVQQLDDQIIAADEPVIHANRRYPRLRSE